MLHIFKTFQILKRSKELTANFGIVFNEPSKNFWLMTMSSDALKQIAQPRIVIDERKGEGQIIEGDALIVDVETR